MGIAAASPPRAGNAEVNPAALNPGLQQRQLLQQQQQQQLPEVQRSEPAPLIRMNDPEADLAPPERDEPARSKPGF